eukprot:s1351_g8.t1
MIDVRQGERGYFSLTTGFLLVCIFTNLLQFAAVGNIIAYGLLHADNCLERPLTDLNWYNIHISKPLRRKRILFILLVTVANGVLFIIATSPDGVWLYITAVEFVNALSRAMVEMSKSGIWGKAISKELTDMNFTLCFQHDYPWWFQPVRFLSHLILFGLIGAFACYAFLMPIQICPSEARAKIEIYPYENDNDQGEMLPGMTFTIEPVLVENGDTTYHQWPDNWTYQTATNSRSAQFEHTILITETGTEILTGPSVQNFTA